MKRKRCYDIGGALSSMGNLVTSWDEATKAKSTLPYESAYEAMENTPFSGDMSQLEAQYRSLNTDPEISKYQLGYLTPSEANASLWGSALSGASTGVGIGSELGSPIIGGMLGAFAGTLLGGLRNDAKNSKAELAAKRLSNYRNSAIINRRNNFKSAVSLADSNNDRWLLSQYAAFGGPLQTNGTIWDTGYTSINEGGSHETNPYGGIQIGVAADGQPNLVEEDEKIMNIQGSPFVFSARSIVDNPEEFLLPKQIKGKSFAEASEWLYEHLGMKDNPNNPINKRGNTAMQERLAAMQETQKQFSENSGHTFLSGGPTGSTFTHPRVKGRSLGYNDINTFPYYHNGAYDKEYRDWLATRDWSGEDKDLFNELSADYSSVFSNRTLQPDQLYNSKTGEGLAVDRMYGKMHQKLGDAFAAWKAQNTAQPAGTTLPEVTVTAPKAETLPMGYQYRFLQPNDVYGAPTEAALYTQDGISTFDNPLTTFNGYPSSSWKYARQEITKDANGRPITVNYYGPNAAPEDVEENTETAPVNTYPTWMRYAPVLGSGLNVLGDIFGLTNVPDYTNADLIHNSVLRPEMIGYQPTGRYMRYNPIDRYNLLNRLEAQSAASTSAAKDLSGGNRATALANIAAQEYANQVALGELGLNIANQDAAQRQAITTHNNKVDQDNANRALTVAQANQSEFERYASRLMEARVKEAALREQIRNAADTARSTNWNTFLTNLGAVGKENMARNMVNTNLANYYTIDNNGNISYRGGYDKLDKATQRAVKREAEQKAKNKKVKKEVQKKVKEVGKFRRGIYFDPLGIMD